MNYDGSMYIERPLFTVAPEYIKSIPSLSVLFQLIQFTSDVLHINVF